MPVLAEIAGFVQTTPGRQPSHSRRHAEDGQRQQRDQRQRSDPEHPAPADQVEQNDGQQRSHQAANRHPRRSARRRSRTARYTVFQMAEVALPRRPVPPHPGDDRRPAAKAGGAMLTPSAEGTTVEPDRPRAPKMARNQQNPRCLADKSERSSSIKLDNRPLVLFHRSSSRLFGRRTYPVGLPIGESGLESGGDGARMEVQQSRHRDHRAGAFDPAAQPLPSAS